jgi:hypothetical protein
MMNLNKAVELTPVDVIWYTDGEGEPCWKPKNPEPGKTYCLVIPPIAGGAFASKSLLHRLIDPEKRKGAGQ